MDIPAMRLLVATRIVDRTNLHPLLGTPHSVEFFEENTHFILTTARNHEGIHAQLHGPGEDAEPLTMKLDPELTPTEQQQRLAEWIVFVVDMTLVIRQLTNAA